MLSTKTIYSKKSPKIFSSDVRAEFLGSFDMIKRYKNIFRKKNILAKHKNIIFRGHNLYKSFFNSTTPYNYFKVPSEKNTFLICYNGGPQIYTYVEKDKLSEELDKKEIIYGDQKSCGCFTKLYVPKLKRSMSNLDSYRINREKFNFSRPGSSYKQNILKNNLSLCNKRDFTPKPFRFHANQNSKNNGLLKRTLIDKTMYRNFSTNNENRSKINYEDSKNGYNDENLSNLTRKNKYDSLLFQLNRNINKKFHKTQIFDQCKPFLSEGL